MLDYDKLSSGVIEPLQILRFGYKQDWLNFTADLSLVADEHDYVISGPVALAPRAVDELMARLRRAHRPIHERE